ncbi:MAG: hypothetical protein OXH00_23140 [Candidatus Poribacteria bacterium]|nr:hypothetical protein [Candidatus Poribacteria bacterium]
MAATPLDNSQVGFSNLLHTAIVQQTVIILGEGKVQNIDIYARDGEFNWKEIKKIKDTVTFPLEITMVANTDAIRIIQKSMTGKGQIHTVEFYTLQ